MKQLSRQNVVDILYGCTILGTGGGGSLEKGICKIDDALEKGKEFILKSFDEVNTNDLIATPYSCGAISPLTEEEVKKYANLPEKESKMHVIALENIEKHLGQEVKGIISTELGGGNTAVAFYAAAMSGKYIVDGDPAGRSVPELQHSTYYLNDVSITPIAVVNKFGESAIITDVVDDYRAEALVRSLAVASQNTIAVVDHVATAGKLEDAVIRGAISDALQIGEAFREAKEGGEDIAIKVAEAGGGELIFRGTIRSNEWGTVEGFTVGDLFVQGKGEYDGEELRVWYKNENIITWKNGEYYFTVPDLVCIFNDDIGEPLLNPYGEKDMSVSVIVLPAPKEWTTKRGLEVFGPKSFGFDIDWKSYEK